MFRLLYQVKNYLYLIHCTYKIIYPTKKVNLYT